jgi:hypothetical protein
MLTLKNKESYKLGQIKISLGNQLWVASQWTGNNWTCLRFAESEVELKEWIMFKFRHPCADITATD